MKSVYLVYETDAWHSATSMELIGVCTTWSNCVEIIKSDIKQFNRDKFSDDDKFELEHYGQTQGREVNFIVKEVHTNKML